MTNELVIDVGAVDDTEYAAFVEEMDRKVPAIVAKGLDLSKLWGNLENRTAKAIILHLTCECLWSISDIAETFGMTRKLAYRYLDEAVRDYIMPEDVDAVRQFELMKLDAQAKVCHEGTKRSFEDEVTVREVLDKDGEVHELTTRRGQSGNPGWQRALTDIGRRRDRLLGLEQPTKVEVDKTERKLVVTEVIVRTPKEAIAAREAGLLK